MSLANNVLQPRSGSSLSRALIITRRELRDMSRDWRIVTPISILVILLPFILAAILSGNQEYLVKQITADTFYNKLLPFTMLAIGFFPMSFCLVIALETFVGEKERNSLEALLTAPLTDFELFLGKYIAATVPTVAASMLGSFVFYVLMFAFGLPIQISLPLVLTFLALNGCEALVMVAASVLVSTHTTSVRAANILASFIILPMSLIVQLEAVLLLTGSKNAMYFVLVALVVFLVILLRSGVKVFNREEIVSREGDNTSLKGLFRGFGYYFKHTPKQAIAGDKSEARFNLWRLYRHDIPQIIGLGKGAYILIGVCLVAGIGLTYWISYWPEVRNFSDTIDSLKIRQNPLCNGADLSKTQVLGVNASWGGIFTNNTLALFIGSALSIITLGVGGIGILMASIAPIGAIAGILIQHNINPLFLLAFLVPHGVLELPALFIGFAAALKIGNALFNPPPGMTLGQSFQFAVVNYIKVLALVIPMLFVAAFIESTLTAPIGCFLTGGGF